MVTHEDIRTLFGDLLERIEDDRLSGRTRIGDGRQGNDSAIRVAALLWGNQYRAAPIAGRGN